MALKVIEDKRDKKVAAKGVEVSKPTLVPAKKTMLDVARAAYLTLQTSWYQFAKSMKEIKDNAEWEVHGYSDFTSLCKAEFDQISYPTIVKFIKVIDEFGSTLESKIKKAESLPSYEVLYQFTVNEDKMPKVDAANLRKLAVEGKVSGREVKEAIRILVSKTPTKHGEGRAAKKERRREELETLDVAVVEKEVVETVSDVEVNTEDELSSSIDQNAAALIKMIQSLKGQLPSITQSAITVTDKLVELAEVVEEAVAFMNEYLDKIEELSADME